MTPLHPRVGFTTSEAVMALRLIKSQGTGSPFSSLAVIQSSDLLCSFPKQICRIYGSRLPKRWERGFHTQLLTTKTSNYEKEATARNEISTKGEKCNTELQING